MVRLERGVLTISARLYRSLDVSDALHGDTVLVVAIDILVLQLADLVKEHAKLVGDIRDVLVADFAPNGEL